LKNIHSEARKHVLVIRDKACLNADDDGGRGWREKGKGDVAAKRREKALMAGEFLTGARDSARGVYNPPFLAKQPKSLIQGNRPKAVGPEKLKGEGTLQVG
jgi:hypothetical protein